jgi:hypothetical protein
MADRPGAFTETPLDVPLDKEVAHLTIRAWKDDPAWAKKTSTFLKRALPGLSTTIGLPYARTSTLVVEETVSRSIEGLAGIYDPSAGTIRIAYTASPGVMLREAAHLWYDGSVFADRWTVEGLASFAASAAAQRLKLEDAVGPGAAPSAQLFPLNAWTPGSGPVEESGAADGYGYAASAELIRLVATRTGADGLRAVVAAAAARPAGDPIDWRGLLDLLQVQAGVDATDLWRTWVVRPEDALLLDARATARFEQAALIREANGWILPAEIDAALDAWRFDEASATISESRSVLQARDDLAVAAAVAGLEPPTNLRTAFEEGDLDAATAEAAVERAIVDQIVAAQAAGAATSSSWLVRVGLLGQDPNAELASARAAFSAGDLSAAQARAIGAREAWVAASDLGGLRLRSILALLLVLALAALLIVTRTRRHPRRARVGYESEIG